MNPSDCAEFILDAILGCERAEELKHYTSYDAAMVLSNDEGIILTFENGDEFYITIKQK